MVIHQTAGRNPNMLLIELSPLHVYSDAGPSITIKLR